MKVGIDLGTTSLSALLYQDYVMRELVKKGEQVPTFATKTRDALEVGRKAMNRRIEPGAVSIDNLKRRVLKEKTLGCRTTVLISYLLIELKALAQKALGEPITTAVAGIPNDFGIAQRRVYQEAFREAYFEEVQLVSEPAAAIIGYLYRQPVRPEGRYLIYDYGGGTADVTIGRWLNDTFYVDFVLGDNSLGGRDLDDIMMHLIIQEFTLQFRKKFPLNLHIIKVQRSPAFYRLRDIARRTKEALSSNQEVTLHEVVEGVPIDGLIINREMFEAAAARDFNTARNLCIRSLHEAQIQPADLDYVLLTGGTSRIPGFRASIADLLDPDGAGKIIHDAENATTLVGQGLAYLGANPERFKIQDIYHHDIGLELYNTEADIVPLLIKGEKKQDLDVREVVLDDKIDMAPMDSRFIKIILSEVHESPGGGRLLLPLEAPFQIDLKTELGVRKEEYDGEILAEFWFEQGKETIEFDFKFAGEKLEVTTGDRAEIRSNQFVDEDAVAALKNRIESMAFKLGQDKGAELLDVAESKLTGNVEIDEYLYIVDLVSAYQLGM